MTQQEVLAHIVELKAKRRAELNGMGMYLLEVCSRSLMLDLKAPQGQMPLSELHEHIRVIIWEERSHGSS